MATNLRTTLKLQLAAVLTDEVGSFSVGPALQQLLQNGFALNQCDVLYAKQHTINTASPTVLNLADGSLKMPNNNTAAFAKVCEFFAQNLSPEASTTQLVRVGGGSNALSWLPSQLVGGPNASLNKFDPSLAAFPVTAVTAMNAQISADAGAAVPVLIVIVGRSA
jgi:hypothetical protein